jgi:hypothetical protein
MTRLTVVISVLCALYSPALAEELWHRLLGFCGIGSWGSWGGQRPSLAAYVAMAGFAHGATAVEGR